MGNGAPAKPQGAEAIRLMREVRAEKVEKIRQEDEDRDTSSTGRQLQQPTAPQAHLLKPPTGPKKLKKTKSQVPMHCMLCSDRDLKMCHSIKEAYPIQNTRTYTRLHTSSTSADESTVMQQCAAPRSISCTACGKHLLDCSAHKAFYSCLRCRREGIVYNLCVGCHDSGHRGGGAPQSAPRRQPPALETTTAPSMPFENTLLSTNLSRANLVRPDPSRASMRRPAACSDESLHSLTFSKDQKDEFLALERRWHDGLSESSTRPSSRASSRPSSRASSRPSSRQSSRQTCRQTSEGSG